LKRKNYLWTLEQVIQACIASLGKGIIEKLERIPIFKGLLYAYCNNNPVNFIDKDGREISFSYEWEMDKDGNYVKNANGGYNLTGITMNVTGKVINVSSNSNVNLTDATKRISDQIESSFSGKADGVTFSTNVNLSAVNSMNDVAESDHIFALADINSPKDGTINGASNLQGGKVAFIDADYFSGPWDTSFGGLGPRTAAHEFGHLGNLGHQTDKSNLMRNNIGNTWWTGGTKLTNGQLRTIHESWKNGTLNLDGNHELIPNYNFTTGKTQWIKMPNRGMVKSLIKY
jgi:hypothetical protein